jgi:hypothetical protein
MTRAALRMLNAEGMDTYLGPDAACEIVAPTAVHPNKMWRWVCGVEDMVMVREKRVSRMSGDVGLSVEQAR